MRVLVTRPQGDGETLKRRLEEWGCTVTLEPLIRIVPNDISPDIFAGASTLIVTSRNALKALAASPALSSARKLPVLTVGPGTAALASELGFSEIFEGPGTGAELAPEIARRAQRSAETFVYLSGDKLAFDLPAALAKDGVNIQRAIAYRSVAAETLSPEVAQAIANGSIDVVVLMSPRTAEVWTNLAPRVAKSDTLAKVAYACISQAAANVVKARLAAQNTIVADRPNLEEIFIVLKRLAARPEAE